MKHVNNFLFILVYYLRIPYMFHFRIYLSIYKRKNQNFETGNFKKCTIPCQKESWLNFLGGEIYDSINIWLLTKHEKLDLQHTI